MVIKSTKCRNCSLITAWEGQYVTNLIITFCLFSNQLVIKPHPVTQTTHGLENMYFHLRYVRNLIANHVTFDIFCEEAIFGIFDTCLELLLSSCFLCCWSYWKNIRLRIIQVTVWQVSKIFCYWSRTDVMFCFGWFCNIKGLLTLKLKNQWSTTNPKWEISIKKFQGRKNHWTYKLTSIPFPCTRFDTMDIAKACHILDLCFKRSL